MPSSWSPKDERMYQAIKKSCLDRDARKTKSCTRMAAATVNKRRREEGRTLNDITLYPTGQPHNVHLFTGYPWIDVLSVIGLGIFAVLIARSYEKAGEYERQAKEYERQAKEAEERAKN